MSKFTDTITINIESGKGGAGAVSFRREKYIAKGGPDGGDGGQGGGVYFEASQSYVNLSHLFKDRIYKAENGQPGMGRNKHGRNGNDLVIFVPPGTEIIDKETGDVLCNLLKENERIEILKGGIGGKGNEFFKTSTNQTPRFSQPGMPGESRALLLNLKLIAEVGLVGLPNTGKSTLLSKITNAKPKIGDYPFTTIIPNLGTVQHSNGSLYKIADIPGIIEGAHKGHGLGLSFLRHIERVKIILYIIDCTEPDPVYNLELLRNELKTYNENLVKKPYYVVLSKADLLDQDEINRKAETLDTKNILAISSVTNYNIQKLVEIIDTLLL